MPAYIQDPWLNLNVTAQNLRNSGLPGGDLNGCDFEGRNSEWHTNGTVVGLKRPLCTRHDIGCAVVARLIVRHASRVTVMPSSLSLFKGSIRLRRFERPSVPAAPGSHTSGSRQARRWCEVLYYFQIQSREQPTGSHLDFTNTRGRGGRLRPDSGNRSTSENLGGGVVPLPPDPQPTSLPNPTSKRALTRPTLFIRYLHQRDLPHRIIFPSTT